jgi:hypothetical protein
MAQSENNSQQLASDQSSSKQSTSSQVSSASAKHAPFRLPQVSKTRQRLQPDDKDLDGTTTLGIQEVLRSDFDSSGALSEASLSSVEGRRGYDLSWYKENHFLLYVKMTMEPIDVFASSDDFIFSQDVVETNIQQFYELEMSKVSNLNRCFVNIKATATRQAEKFLNIPLKVVMVILSGRAKQIRVEACPPQSTHPKAVTRDVMKEEMLKLKCKFPVVYKESYKKRDETPRFWCCSLMEESPTDEMLCLSVEFQIQFNEEKVNKDVLVAWEIIHKWMKDSHQYDMDDETRYERRLVTGRQFTAQIAHRVTQPKFFVTFNAKNFEELSQKCYVL